MKYTTLIEKLLSIFNVISKSYFYIGFIAICLFLLMLLFIKKINKKTCFIGIFLTLISLMGYTIYTHFDNFSSIINDLTLHFFTGFYFPSIHIYLILMLIVWIVSINSFLFTKKNSGYRTFNGIFFLILNFIMIIILDMVTSKKIDLFNKASLFKDTTLVTLLEFSVLLFTLWIIGEIIIYLTNKIYARVSVKEKKLQTTSNEDSITAINLSVDEPELDENQTKEPAISLKDKVYATKEEEKIQFIPTFNLKPLSEVPAFRSNTFVDKNVSSATTNPNYSNLGKEEFDLSSFIPNQEKRVIIPDVQTSVSNTSNQIFEAILNNSLPLIENEPKKNEVSSEKNQYTLNDYRIFNKILKEIQEYNQDTNIHVDKLLEYRLITKYSLESYDLFKKMLKNYSN